MSRNYHRHYVHLSTVSRQEGSSPGSHLCVGCQRVCVRSAVFWWCPGPPQAGLSFSFPQDDVDEAADQAEREGYPGQDVGVAEVCPRVWLGAHHCVDDGSTHHEQAGQDLENGSKVEASIFDQVEELIHKGNQGEETEEHRQDHEGLHRLDPVFIARGHAVVSSIVCATGVPQIRAACTYSPRINNC